MASENDASTDRDVEYFAGSFSAFHKTMPDENQHIIGQVIKQVQEATHSGVNYLSE